MAKLNLPPISTLANSAPAIQAVNDRLAEIESAIDNTLSRDGTLPNQMEADIDLNSNDLLNVQRIDATEYYRDGVPLEQVVYYGNKLYQIESGDGVRVTWPLVQHPGSVGNLEVSVAGLVLRPVLDYNFSDANITFVSPPANAANNILIRFDLALPTGITDVDGILYNAGGAGSISRSMGNRLKDNKSVHDYDALGDGTTNDADNLDEADTSNALRFLAGKTYRISSNVTLNNDLVFERGAKLLIDAAIVVTINGRINAPLQQIFSGSGTVAGLAKVFTVYPEWWGAVPDDGSTNSTSAVQAAITAGYGKEVVFSAMYRITAAIVATGALKIKGREKTNCGLKTTSGTAHIIQLSCSTNILTGVEIRDIQLDATSAKTAGYGIAITASSGGTVYNCLIENITMSANMFGGLSVQACFYLTLRNISVISVGSNAFGFWFHGVDSTSKVANVKMIDCEVRFGTAGGNTCGTVIDSYSEGFYVRQCSMESAGLNYGVYIDNSLAAPRPPENLWFYNVICDNHATHGWNILSALTLHMTDCWSTSCSVDGVRLAGGTDIEIKGHSSISNGQYGIEIKNATKQVKILGGTVDANSQAASNTYDGIVVEANTTDFTINDVDFFRTGTTKSHRNDISVLAGTSDRYIIKNNRLRGYLNAGLSDGGSGVNKFVGENIT